MEDASFGIVPIRARSREVLLVQSLEGVWGLPKGHPEPEDADAVATALRELREETGITSCEVDAARTFDETYTFIRNGIVTRKHNRFFLGFVGDEAVTPQEGEIREARWFDYKAALEIVTFEEAKQVIKEAYAFIA
ncbi:MAG TPA: NUDIX domain-containing protein [Candidatus Paceibacterota bacterium]|jgi:8-oxo-dGTP pyrophosphatase MutT (NUDIX family)